MNRTPRDVTAGRHEVKVEYYDNVAPASIDFSWRANNVRAASTIFSDIPEDDPSHEAVTELAARGIVRGYGDGRFGVGDPAVRAQMAALLARAAGWDGEDWGNGFSDQGEVDADLWRNIGALAYHGVARGYGDGTYNPTGTVLQAQAISFVTRLMVSHGWWTPQADDPTYYANMADPGHRPDLATFIYYAGAIPDLPTDGAWAGWDAPCTRGWFARVLWQALLTVDTR